MKDHTGKLDGRVEEEESQETKVSSRKAQAEAAVQETGVQISDLSFSDDMTLSVSSTACT